MRADVRVARFLVVSLFGILIFSLKPVFSGKGREICTKKFSKQFFTKICNHTLYKSAQLQTPKPHSKKFTTIVRST
jgi:hypothetical protein